MSEDDFLLFPVANITVEPVLAMQLVIMKLDFLTHSMQSENLPNPGRRYVLSENQVRELISMLQTQLHHLKTAAFQPAPGDKH